MFEFSLPINDNQADLSWALWLHFRNELLKREYYSCYKWRNTVYWKPVVVSFCDNDSALSETIKTHLLSFLLCGPAGMANKHCLASSVYSAHCDCLPPQTPPPRQLTHIKQSCEGEPAGEGVSALTTEERTRWAKVNLSNTAHAAVSSQPDQSHKLLVLITWGDHGQREGPRGAYLIRAVGLSSLKQSSYSNICKPSWPFVSLSYYNVKAQLSY